MYEYKAIVTRVIDGDTIDVDIQLGFDVVLAKEHGIKKKKSGG